MSILVNADNWGFDFVQGAEPSEPYEGLTWYDNAAQAYKEYHNSAWHIISLVPTTVGNNFGYMLGGYSPTYSTVDRIQFPFDSGFATTVGLLSTSRLNARACNSSNYGYLFGGAGYNGTLIDRLTFPFNSGTSTQVGFLSVNKQDNGSCNSSNYGFSVNGRASAVTQSSNIERILFPFDSGTATITGFNSVQCSRNECVNSSDYGFSMGGIYYIGSYYNTAVISRFEFPFDSGTASSVGSLNHAKEWGGSYNSSDYGYYSGGINVGSFTFTYIDRIAFPFDSGTASNVGDLTSNRFLASGCNSTNYGYCLGGQVATYKSIIDRITFPFDSGTASHVGNLTVAKGHAAGLDGTDFVTLFN